MSEGGRHPFNVRVYGLLIEDGNVLISDERVNDLLITKFPGGGLEFGEGPVNCLIREWKEELDQKVEIESHFYTTELFQRSAFRDEDQIISIYYLVRAEEPMKVELREKPFDLKNEEEEAFRWLDIEQALVEDLTFPIDRIVLEMLKRSQEHRE